MSATILALLEQHDISCQVKDCLASCGFRVIVAETFAKAIVLLGAEKIDLIVSDVHLENGGSVFDFLRLVKKGGQWSGEIPFVLFSFKPTPLAKFVADGARTTARYLGAAKWIEMETFDATQFQEQIKSLLSPADHSIERHKLQKLYEEEIGE